ncbi:hypothetical protein LCGC14_2590210 [marine sediment metagenome]|uniref:Uncharacterized protein n=1 Tax=marine sediment metagenome TaxID=412755 RepID=A0A0F9CMX5_9ZZZZ
MRLTKKLRNQITLELWEWLAETGKRKYEWPGWKKYGHMYHTCPLCEYGKTHSEICCGNCPLWEQYGGCFYTYYEKWAAARTTEDNKKFALLFLEQLREVLK